MTGDRLIVPGDKSIAHRAVWCAALARGESLLRGVPESDDVAATCGVVQALGVRMVRVGTEVRIEGCGGAWPIQVVSLDIGASGTTLRLLCGLLAAAQGTYHLRVAAQLGRRPIEHVLGLLRAMGAEVESVGWGTADAQLRIRGRQLHGVRCALPVASAQLKCAFLLAALQADSASWCAEPVLTRDHLERMLPQFGAKLSHVRCPTCCNAAAADWLHVVPGPLRAAAINIPGDLSAAAPWIAMALVLRQRPLTIAKVGLNPTRLGMVRILQRMGARIELHAAHDAAAGEPYGDLTIFPSCLRGTTVLPSEVPSCIDELPLLIALAGLAQARTHFRGLTALRSKESDRLQHTVAACRAAGMALEQPDGDTLWIDGRPALRATPQQFPRTDDHRMVMLFSVLSLLADPRGPVQIPDACAVAKSYPGYWRDFQALWPDSECESF